MRKYDYVLRHKLHVWHALGGCTPTVLEHVNLKDMFPINATSVY